MSRYIYALPHSVPKRLPQKVNFRVPIVAFCCLLPPKQLYQFWAVSSRLLFRIHQRCCGIRSTSKRIWQKRKFKSVEKPKTYYSISQYNTNTSTSCIWLLPRLNRPIYTLPTTENMDPSANGAACRIVSIEIKELTPREARQAKTEAEYRGSLVTESEGTISHLHQLIAWYNNLRKT